MKFLLHQPGIHIEISNFYGENIFSIAALNNDEQIMEYLKTIKVQKSDITESVFQVN